MGLQATNAGIDFQQRVSAYMMIIAAFCALKVNLWNRTKSENYCKMLQTEIFRLTTHCFI